MAEDREVFFGIKLLVGAGRDVAHGHWGAWFDMCGRVFPRLADINEPGLVFAEECLSFGWRDFVFEHENSLVGRAGR